MQLIGETVCWISPATSQLFWRVRYCRTASICHYQNGIVHDRIRWFEVLYGFKRAFVVMSVPFSSTAIVANERYCLHVLCRGHADVIVLLYQYGVDTCVQNKDGMVPAVIKV